MTIKLDYSRAMVGAEELERLEPMVEITHNLLHNKEGAGKEFLGWLDFPEKYDKEEFARLKEAAKQIQDSSDVLLVIGIGGSYLGARAVIESLSHSFYNKLSKEQRKTPQIFYVGNNISSNYISDLMDLLEGKDLSLNVISKSGTTTEPAIAFRIFKEYMENKYGEDEARKRIYATTDKERGALKELANQEGYQTFVIPDDLGGRYSVFSPVGLLPIAVAGLDIDQLMEGAYQGQVEYGENDINKNIAYKYAILRNILYKKGKYIEILVNYEPNLVYLSEWWKQLFGESEGKDGKGIYPSSLSFTTDLHSLGQYVQDGKRNIFETTINIEKSKKNILIKESPEDLDQLNFLAGKSLDLVNKKAFEGTVQAHIKGQVPNIIIDLPELNEFHLGKLLYFFMKSCGFSGYLLGVNPFDQPGVEEYKKNMFNLLGKPGY